MINFKLVGLRISKGVSILDKYEIYNKINDLLDTAINDLNKDDLNWLINGLISDLEDLKEDC